MSETIYCGSGKVRETQYGKMISLFVQVDKLMNEAGEFMFDTKSGKCVRLDLNKRKAPDQQGNEYSLKVNTWKPEGQRGGERQSSRTESAPVEDDNLPF